MEATDGGHTLFSAVGGRRLWVTVLILLAAVAPARAAHIQFEFEAELDFVEAAYADYFGPTGTLSFVVDTTTAGTPQTFGVLFIGAISDYQFDAHNPVSGFTLAVTASSGDIFARDGVSSTDVYSGDPLALSDNVAGETLTDGGFTFWGPTTFLSADAILDDASDFDPLSQFTLKQIVFRAQGFPSEVAMYNVTSISSEVAAIPSPSVHASGLVMLCALGGTRARRRRSRQPV